MEVAEGQRSCAPGCRKQAGTRDALGGVRSVMKKDLDACNGRQKRMLPDGGVRQVNRQPAMLSRRCGKEHLAEP